MAMVPPKLTSNSTKKKSPTTNKRKSLAPPGGSSAADSTFNPFPKYVNYDIENMQKEQQGKEAKKVLRFSLSVQGGPTFSAHVDPQHLTDAQGKRLVLVDVLTGIIAQDFGYIPETIELQGTTGARYYTEVRMMDQVFKSQSTNGTPTPCTLVIEGRTYSVAWKDFQYDREAQENVYKYTMSFVVLGNYNATGADTAVQKSAQTGKNVNTHKGIWYNGQAIVQGQPWTGKTPRSYVMGNSQIPKSKAKVALQFIAQYWGSDNATAYRGPDSPLNAGELLVVPVNWSTVLSANVLSGNPTVAGLGS